MTDTSYFVTYEQEVEMGNPYSEVHTNRLEKLGKWPKRVAFSSQRKLRVRSEVAARIQEIIDGRGIGGTYLQPKTHSEHEREVIKAARSWLAEPAQ